MSINIFFTFSRIIVVISRTLLLLSIVLSKNDTEATQLALLFTVSASLLMIGNIDAHRDYFSAYFGGRSSFKARRTYVSFLYFMIGFSLPMFIIGFIVLYLTFKSFFIAILFSYVVFFEKIYDEYQRFLIFKKEFYSWSILALLVYALPAILVALVNISEFSGVIASYVLLSFLIDIFLLYYIIKSSGAIRIIKTMKIKKYLSLSVYARKLFLSRFVYLLVNVASGHVMIMTRYIVVFMNPAFFPIYVLLLNISNGIITMINIFYLSYRRQRYIENRFEAVHALRENKLIMILFTSTLLSIIISSGVLLAKNELNSTSLFLVITITLMGAIYGLSVLVYESIFWQKGICERILSEFLYLLIVGLIWVIILNTAISLQTLTLLFVTAIFIRFIVLVAFLLRKKRIQYCYITRSDTESN